MKLYHSPASPFVRKVIVLLHELGRSDDIQLETITTTAMASDEDLKLANPLARIPALVRPDGVTLYDSRVITQFLDDLYDGSLYPKTASRWDVLTLEATGDGIMDSAVSMVYETRLRPESEQSQDWIEAQWSKVDRTLAVLNDRWMGHLAGPVSMGHISVACALSYLDFRHDVRGWRQGRDDLATWHAKFSDRQSMQESLPPAS